MAETASIFGGPLDLGPCNGYWDTATGGQNLFLGGFDQTTVRFGAEETDLFTAQKGTSAADGVITSGMTEVEFGLAESTLERMAALIPGFEINVNTAGDAIGFSFGAAIGARRSSREKQLRLVRVFDEIESTDPLDEFLIWRIGFIPTVELVYDAATQRFTNLLGKARRDPTQLSVTGRPTFFGGGLFNN